MRPPGMTALALTALACTAQAAGPRDDESDRIDRIMQTDPRAAPDPVGTFFMGTPANGSGAAGPGYTLDSLSDRTQRLGGRTRAPQAGPIDDAGGTSPGKRAASSKRTRRHKGSKSTKRSKRSKRSRRAGQ